MIPIRCRLGFHTFETAESEVAGGYVKRERYACARCGEGGEVLYTEKVRDGPMVWYV